VKLVKEAIQKAGPEYPLRGLPSIKDSSEIIIEAHLQALKWNILQHRFGLVAHDPINQQKNSVDLLEILKSNLPEKNGQISGWKFEKEHSILHKEIMILGWSENFITQVRLFFILLYHIMIYIFELDIIHLDMISCCLHQQKGSVFDNPALPVPCSWRTPSKSQGEISRQNFWTLTPSQHLLALTPIHTPLALICALDTVI
jgi:hypothetical protein